MGQDQNLLEKNYLESKLRYYREIQRKKDEEQLKRILKIPDSWEINGPDGAGSSLDFIKISDTEKKKLSGIKKFKSQELEFESHYINNLLSIENTFFATLNYREINREELIEAKESTDQIIKDLGKNIENFKHLLLNLAKKSISDLYYLVISYTKYYKKKDFVFISDFEIFLKDMVQMLHTYRATSNDMSLYAQYKKLIDPLFLKTSSIIGLKIDDFKIKKLLEDGNNKELLDVDNLEITASRAFLLEKKMKKDYNFINFYYNDRDGKLFRYNFIVKSMAQKLKDNKITWEMNDRFLEMRNNFILLKNDFERKGLEEFGPGDMNYFSTLEFIYKICKILENIYLRSSKYDKLQNLRNKILFYAEKEYNKMSSFIKKYSE